MKTTFTYQPARNDPGMSRPMARTLNFPEHQTRIKQIMKKSNEQDKGKGLGKWIFFFIFGICMFFLGIIWGRYTAPLDFDVNTIEIELAKLKQDEAAREKEEIKTGIASLNEKSLDFYEDLRKGSGSLIAVIPGNQGEPEIKKALSTKKNIHAENQEQITAPAPDLDSNPGSAVKENKPANTEEPVIQADPDSETMDLAIQVASFAVLKDAESLVASLKQKGYSGTYHTDEDIPGVGKRYRVKVGYFSTRNDAKAVLNKLKDNEKIMDAYIVKRKQ